MEKWFRVLFSVLFLMVAQTGIADATKEIYVPADLEPWKAWVLHGEEHRVCPVSFDNGEEYRCIWPSRLNLDLDLQGGRFRQDWLVFTRSWVPLPGNKESWPRDVQANGNDVPVLEKNGHPSIALTPGEYAVEGRFEWDQVPDMIHVPPAAGLVTLTINGSPVPFPLQESDGRLWLKRPQTPRSQEDRLEVRAYRLLQDEIPMEMTSLLRVNISGQAREVLLDGVLLEGFIPMRIQSPIPARIAPDGRLILQARPGRWEIRVIARSEGPVHRIGPLDAPFGQEVWAFQPQNHLRMVHIEGVPPVDPNQTDSPQEWRQYATYLMNPDSEMIFKEIRRGDPDPAPDRLSLERTWWLDFDGKGFTLMDRVSGTMSRQWYLAMNPPVNLGRVTVDGTDLLITGQGEDKKPGVELRRGQLDMTAESRIEDSLDRYPAVGWDHEFQSVSGTLHLPPGWRLLTVRGVDVMPGTWFERWTLLDLFLVLIMALAVAKLWGWHWGLLALATVALTYHEPGAPRIVWLNLLAASALLRFLPKGWIRRAIGLWRLASIVTLLALSIPFMVQQIRWGVYPQLEPRHGAAPRAPRIQGLSPRPKLADMGSVVPMDTKRAPGLAPKAEQMVMERKLDYYANQAVQAVDADALNQTGPGLPDWTWRSFAMRWNGPVEKDQEIRFRLLSPGANLALAFVRVALLAWLIVILLALRRWKPLGTRFSFATLLILMFLIPGPSRALAAEGAFPPAEILQEFKKRLLEKPDCLPRCAESPHMELKAAAQDLRILFQVHTARETAVPLPGSAEFWLPRQVLLGSTPAKGLLRDGQGSLWLLVPEGMHIITLMGPIPPVNEFQIPLPLTPRRVTYSAEGWDVLGIGQNGRVESSIKLIRRLKAGEDTGKEAAQTALPPFFHVERIISLGLDWQVRSRITRVTPIGTPAVVSIPLLPGESVTTSGIRVQDGLVHVQMAPKMREIRWDSALTKESTLTIRAPTSSPWTESWTLETSPIWHCDLSGIAVIHHQDQGGYWRPQWKPWPGEEVTIKISRPKPIPGQVVTIDSANLTFTPGQRFGKAALALNIRTSRGGQHDILLPDGAKLQRVKIQGREQPIREQDRAIILPLQPGAQSVEVEWHQSADSSVLLRAPEVRIGDEAVNADVTIQMPRNRWILWLRGPQLGPAVLFWSYLVVIVLAALVLGRVPWTPLKSLHWLLLGLGLTQIHPLLSIMIVGWFLALGLRQKRELSAGPFSFNLIQILLVLWTMAALIGLYMAIQKGLLGIPHMQIAGNGSHDFFLHWTQDRIGSTMPRPTVFSLHLMVFRFLMLAWALWLAYSLLKWLRWGWDCFNEGGVWKKIILKKKTAPKQTEGN